MSLFLEILFWAVVVIGSIAFATGMLYLIDLSVDWSIRWEAKMDAEDAARNDAARFRETILRKDAL